MHIDTKTFRLFLASVLCTLLCLFVLPASAATEGDFSYSINDETAEITDYSGSAAELVIPDTLGGYPVTRIGSSAFDGCPDGLLIQAPQGSTAQQFAQSHGYVFRELTK